MYYFCLYPPYQCCLEVLFKNPNIGGEMGQMIHNQENYVPCILAGSCKDIADTVRFHGDQLFDERSRNMQWAFRDGNNKFDKLLGLRTEFADWHAKVTLHEVNVFYKTRGGVYLVFFRYLLCSEVIFRVKNFYTLVFLRVFFHIS